MVPYKRGLLGTQLISSLLRTPKQNCVAKLVVAEQILLTTKCLSVLKNLFSHPQALILNDVTYPNK